MRQEQPTNLLLAILRLNSTIRKIFVDTWKQFEEAEKQQNVVAAIQKLTTTHFATCATAEAAMVVDREPAQDPEELKKLIQQTVAEKTQDLQNEVRSLQNQLQDILHH